MGNSGARKTLLLFIYTGLAVVCFAYGFIIYSTGSGTGFFITWFSIGAVLLLCDIVVAFNIYGKVPKIFKKVLLLFAAMVFSSFITVESFIISGFFSDYVCNLDYIIVLGAQVYPEGPSAILKYRLDEAAKYLNQNLNTKCIFSGGQGHNEPFAEAISMKKYLEDEGIEKKRIIMEPDSKNTNQNITNSMKYIEPGKSVGIVTNNFHMFRALQTAKKQGLSEPHAIVAGIDNLYLPNNMLREYFGELSFLISQNGG